MGVADRPYQLALKRQAIRALQRMPRQEALRIRLRLDMLAQDPGRRDLDVAPLAGRPAFRLRVGDIRIIFERDDDARLIDVLRIAPRGQAYQEQEERMNRPQVIVDADGQPAFAVIPWKDYERLTNEADALSGDAELYDRAKKDGGESFPMEVVDLLLAGQNPVRVYRRHRRMSQAELAAAAGINSLYLSQIERGKRSGSAKTLAAIAQALDVTVDDLL